MDSREPLPQTLSSEPRRRRRTPPKWVWFVLAVIAILVGVLRRTDILGDHAYANVATVLLAFSALVILAAWFFFLSGYRWWTRVLTLVGCVAGASLPAALLRIERFSGELVPTFAFWFAPEPDRLLPALPALTGGTAKVDLRTTSDDDYPGFLGPYRSNAVEHVGLARNWDEQAPQMLWRQKIGAGWSAFSVVDGHAVTMEQRGEMEMTTCYAVATGQLEWASSPPSRYEKLEAGVGPRSTPTIDDGMVYALGALGHLACLDGASGKLVWERDLFREAGISREDEKSTVPWGRAASPLVVGQQVVVPLGGRKGERLFSLAAFDKRSGELVWKDGKKQISYSSPCLANLGGIEQIVIVNEDTASGHDTTTGKQLWEHSRPGHTNRDPNVSQAVPIAANLVFFSKGYGGGAMLLRLDRGADGALTPQEVWANSRVMRTKFTNVAVQGNYVYGLSDGILECIDVTNGVRKWRDGRYGHGQILRAGDLLLVLSEEGEVVLVEATPDRPNSVLGRFQAIEGLTWNNLALYGPYLLVRNAEEAACYKLPLKER
jgi:outer membrane protein assembly factor BamB